MDQLIPKGLTKDFEQLKLYNLFGKIFWYDKKNRLINHIMGKQKIGLTLDENLIAFLDKVAGGNRSEYLNKLLGEHRKQVLETKMIEALEEDLRDAEYLKEIENWDSVAGDGIDAIG